MMPLDPGGFREPTAKDEAWRFTPLRKVRKFLRPLAQVDGSSISVAGPEWVTSLETPTVPVVPGEYLVPADLPGALAWSLAPDVDMITVPAGVLVEEPITVALTGHGDSYRCLRITVEADAKAVIVVDHKGSGDHVTNVEVETGPRSDLVLTAVQDWDPEGVHLARIHTHVGRDASMRQVVVTSGGSLVRLSSTVSFDGPGGSAEMLGGYHACSGQHLEHRLGIEHSVPHCRSSALYKGVLQGDGSRGVWVGDVSIRPGAVRTDTYEINRNLVLTPGARANSVPNLEIETGDVARAGHASTTGRLDDEQLFYLASRGIEPAVARRLVVRGFLAEIIDKVGDPAIRDRLWAKVIERVECLAPGARGTTDRRNL